MEKDISFSPNTSSTSSWMHVFGFFSHSNTLDKSMCTSMGPMLAPGALLSGINFLTGCDFYPADVLTMQGACYRTIKFDGWVQNCGALIMELLTGDPLHSRAACTQPCNVNTHSRAHCSPGARLCEQWGHGCVNNGARLCASARLCRGSPVLLQSRHRNVLRYMYVGLELFWS